MEATDRKRPAIPDDPRTTTGAPGPRRDRRGADAQQESHRLIAWGQQLRAVHTTLRRALELARDEVEDSENHRLAPGATADLLVFCRGFCLALSGHHRSEDRALFPDITSRRPDLAPVIAQLRQDHSMIEHLLAGLDQAVRTDAPAAETLRHLDGIEAVMTTHFRYEEKMLVQLLDALPDLPGSGRDLLGPPA